jgi:prealbumin domain-containing protein
MFHGGTITDVSGYSIDTTNSDHPTSITITFTTTTASPVLVWGGHIATRLDWGLGNSAVSISGSPYHTRLLSLDGAGGNQDRSLSSDATIFPGSITIIKDAVPDSSVPFTFTPSASLGSPFNLVDDGSVPATNSKLLNNIFTFTTYTVAETTVNGWTLSFASPNPCTIASPNGGSASASGSTLTINMNEGEEYTCTFTNTRQNATLTVIKNVINNNGGTKTASDFHMTVTGGDPSPGSFNGSGTGTSVSITPGVAYSVSEDSVSGYTQTGSTAGCSSTGLPAGGSATCTITNDDQAATLHVIKHVINDNGGTKSASDFAITVTGSSPSPASFNGAESPGTTVTLNAGTYSVDEGAHVGYAKTLSADCSGSIANGESKTCTITNDDLSGTLIVIKHVINDNGGIKVAGDFSMTVTGTNVQPSATFPGVESPGTTVTLNAGSYSVDEAAVVGYTKTLGTDCSGTIANGQTKTCTITNDDTQVAIATVMKWTLKDVANLSGLHPGNQAGTVTFKLSGPYANGDTMDCGVSDSSKLIFTSNAIPVEYSPAGTEGTASTSFDVEVPGIYLWTADFSGDSANQAVSKGCGKEVTEITATYNP